MSEASGHRGLWTKPKYAGDTVRIVELYRGRQLGDIRIQDYGRVLRVAAFLPGITEMPEGDSPKTVPEKYQTYRSANQGDLADALFDAYVQEAYAGGWQNYHPEQHGHDPKP
jgi:hypothetical protein